MPPAPRLNNQDKQVLEEYGFEFSEPPEETLTRRSKYDELWERAREICMKNPGRTLKVLTYDTPSQPYSYAKQINNGEHRMFKDDAQDWKAVARRDGKNENGEYRHSLWLTYEPKNEQ